MTALDFLGETGGYWAGQGKGQQGVFVAVITATSLLLTAPQLTLYTAGTPRNFICSHCGHRCFAFSSSQTWWQVSWASAARGTFPVGVGFMNTICMPKDYCGRVWERSVTRRGNAHVIKKKNDKKRMIEIFWSFTANCFPVHFFHFFTALNYLLSQSRDFELEDEN